MSPLAQVTEVDQGGAVGEEATEDHVGSPERLRGVSVRSLENRKVLII
jgi:hypothetical protein